MHSTLLSQMVLDGLGLDVEPAQEPGHDPTLGHATDARYRHDQFAFDAADAAGSGVGEGEVGSTVQPPRVLLGFETEAAGAPRPIHPYLLDPCQAAGTDQ